MLLFSPCKRCPCPCSDAVLRSCEEALAGIVLHRPPSGLRGFVLVDRWEQGRLGGPRGAGRGGGGGYYGGGGGWEGRDPGPESIYVYVSTYMDRQIHG